MRYDPPAAAESAFDDCPARRGSVCHSRGRPKVAGPCEASFARSDSSRGCTRRGARRRHPAASGRTRVMPARCAVGVSGQGHACASVAARTASVHRVTPSAPRAPSARATRAARVARARMRERARRRCGPRTPIRVRRVTAGAPGERAASPVTQSARKGAVGVVLGRAVERSAGLTGGCRRGAGGAGKGVPSGPRVSGVHPPGRRTCVRTAVVRAPRAATRRPARRATRGATCEGAKFAASHQI